MKCRVGSYPSLLYVFQALQKSNKELGCSITFTTPDEQINRINTGRETNTVLKTEDLEEKEYYNEEILTPGNLMAFAWHVCQGMVSKPPILSYFSEKNVRPIVKKTEPRNFF